MHEGVCALLYVPLALGWQVRPLRLMSDLPLQEALLLEEVITLP